MVEVRGREFTQQQTAEVIELVKGIQALTIPAAVDAAGRAAAQMSAQVMLEQGAPLLQAQHEARGAAGVAIDAANAARLAALQAGQRQPPPPPPEPMVQDPPKRGLDGFLFQSLLPGLPSFAGDDPLKEGMTADHLINHLEALSASPRHYGRPDDHCHGQQIQEG